MQNVRRDFTHSLSPSPTLRLLARGPLHGSATYEVHMQMVHCLVGVASGVEDQSEAGLVDAFLFGHYLGSSGQIGHYCCLVRRHVADARDVLVRDDEHVRRCLGIEISKYRNPVILEDDVSLDLARCDLAENAVQFRLPLDSVQM